MSPFLLVALSFPACEQIQPYIPTVNFQEMQVQALDWEQVDTNFLFSVDNPNPVDIQLARFDYALSMETVEILSGDDPDGLVLSASGASELALPVTLGFDDLYDLVIATRGEDLIDFALAGSFGFDTPVGPVNLPYTEDGDFPALRKPGITFTGITVEDLSFLDATLALNLDIDNDHGSSMLFQQASWVLQLGGLDAGSGLVADLAEVAGASTESVSIPLTIDFLDMGSALYDLLTSGTVDASLEASVDVDTPFGTLPFSFSREGEIPLY